VTAVTPGKLVDHACKASQGHTILPDPKSHRLFQNLRRINARIGTGQFKAAVKQLGKPFCQRKANNGK
jgi:hypothetical protein